MKTLAAVVVTYNRSSYLEKNIAMLLKQTKKFDKIFIINNNSTDDTVKIVESFGSPIIELINLEDNIGGAGGFCYGTKMAFERDYDFIVLMDDDGRPYDENTIKNLYEAAYNIKSDKLFLNSLVFENFNKLSFGLGKEYKNVYDIQNNSCNNILENRINPFNGSLLSRELISEIGYPNGEFFIKGDESDFKKRAEMAGAYVATVTNSLYYHPSIQRTKGRFLFIKFNNDLEAPWKEYYRARNYTYSIGKSFRKELFIRKIKSFLVHDKLWIARIKMIKHGFKDGINKKMGRVVSPGQIKYEN